MNSTHIEIRHSGRGLVVAPAALLTLGIPAPAVAAPAEASTMSVPQALAVTRPVIGDGIREGAVVEVRWLGWHGHRRWQRH